MIAKHSIENLKNNLDIVDVISSYLELKKSGANFKACCPFHGEKTPSFVVSPQKQIYHCFGCGVGGDAIKFVMDYEKLSYPETLEKLAQEYNISLEYDNKDIKKTDFSVIKSINQYYQKLLEQNSTAKEYLQSRGVSNASIEKFEIGFAGKSSDTLNFLKNNFLNLADAKEFGIIDSGTNGLYARFIDRITFPIYNQLSNIVGFGGRTISGHNAKYINSPQTKYFNKSKLLYGYNIAKESIFKNKKIIITEGYLDVIMLHQAGFNYSVATLGTALTKEHLPLLRKTDAKVILAYDGDMAGQNAAYKASLILSQSSFEGGVVIFSGGVDPADMVKDGRVEELNNIFNRSKNFIEYCIDFIIKKFDLNDPLQKQQCVKDINSYIKTLDPILQEEYSSYIASVLNINKNFIKVEYQAKQSRTNAPSTVVDIGELSIIRTALEDQEMLNLIIEHLHRDMFLYHKREFDLLKENKDDPSLLSLLLNEQLKVLSKEQLNEQIKMLSIPFYTNQLKQIQYDQTLNFRKKTRLIRELRLKLQAVKR